MAAKKFQFHDLVMKSSGPQWDMAFGDEDENDDESQDKKKLGGACDLVFQYSNELANTHDILCTLEVLQKSKFNTKVVPTTDFELFQSTMRELLDLDDRGRREGNSYRGDRMVGNLLKSRVGDAIRVP